MSVNGKQMKITYKIPSVGSKIYTVIKENRAAAELHTMAKWCAEDFHFNQGGQNAINKWPLTFEITGRVGRMKPIESSFSIAIDRKMEPTFKIGVSP